MCLVCSPLNSICRKFLSCHQGMGRGGKRPETFLTPYEMELLPMMLKELDKVNSRFYQMVCYRWLQSATSKTIDGDSIRTKKSTIDYPTGISREAKSSIEDSNKAANKVSLEECCFEGSALKELIRQLAKSLMEKGTFDETCEFMLRDYRCQREESRCRAATFPQDKKRAYFIRRSTFNGGDSEVLNTPKSGTSNGPKKQPNSSNSSSSSGSKSSESELIKTEQQPVRGGVPRRLLLRRSPATIRGVSVRERKAIAKMGDSLFAELGEVLLSEFHSVVYAHPQAFDVHEREMKILVWRHFTQMLVSILNDRGRFPADK